MDIAVNYLAIVATTVVNIVLGFLWYGPVFGKPWMREMGFTQEDMKAAQQKGMGKTYALMVVGALVLNYVLAQFVVLFGATDYSSALQLAFWAWLGFVATTMLGQVFWESKSWTLYVINTAYYLVAISIAAVILAMWPA